MVFRISLSKGAPFKETVLHSFCAQSGCPDGAQPLSGITIAKNGDLYGTTEFGNAFSGGNCQGSGLGCGTAFRLRNGVLTVLYNFCPQGPQSGCPEGAEPSSGPPLLDTAGDVIGSTFAGGVNSPTAGKGGTIFELTQ